MRVPVFSSQPYDREFLSQAALGSEVEWEFLDASLDHSTARLALGHPTVCVFVNDLLERETLEMLHASGLRGIALRCAGFNNVDLETTTTVKNLIDLAHARPLDEREVLG